MKLIKFFTIKLYSLLILLFTLFTLMRGQFSLKMGDKDSNPLGGFGGFFGMLSKLFQNKFLQENKNKLQSKNSFSFYYDHFFNRTRSNVENINTSKSFFTILSQVTEFFPSDKNKTFADKEILRLRSMHIDKVTDFFVNYKIHTTSEYWYVYYLLSNVALKGHIVNRNRKPVAWKATEPDENEVFKDFKNDKFFKYLKKNEAEISQKIGKCKKRTIYEVKRIEKQEMRRSANPKTKKLQQRSPQQLNKLNLNDYYFEKNFLKYIFRTKFFKKISKKFPKGIVHHIHLGAIASKTEMQEVFRSMFGGDFKIIKKNRMNKKKSIIDDSKNNQTIIYVKAYEEDRFKKGQFYDILFSKLYYVTDFFKTAELAKRLNYEALFKENYIISGLNCSLYPMKNRTLILDVELVAYFYIKFCEHNIIFTRNQKIIDQVNKLKNPLTSILPIPLIEEILSYAGGILDFHNNIAQNRKILPKSYFQLLFNIKDLLSNGIWFRFESVFGFYDNLFDNPNMISHLLKIVAHKYKSVKISGMEFRQKNDLDKKFSKLKAIREAFSKEGIETAFILPGRKVTSGNKFDDTIKGIMSANSSDISGIDFLGYEDDPFTGARNFFPVVLENIFDPNRKNDPQKSKFEVLFNTLKSGKSLYLHAGETKYFPNYPVTDKFMKKFYINDNLFHSALLPNVKRVGHGFAVGNNDLLMNIFKKKNIHLEICPISNQLLLYWNVQTNPFLRLLRNGLSVSISSDDPGFFGYTGATVDWFTVINQTGINPSEMYMLLKYSVLRASPNIAAKKNVIIKKIQNDFKAFINSLDCAQLTKKEEKSLKITPKQIAIRMMMKNVKKENLLKIIHSNGKYDEDKDEPLIDIYDKSSIKSFVDEFLAALKNKGGMI